MVVLLHWIMGSQAHAGKVTGKRSLPDLVVRTAEDVGICGEMAADRQDASLTDGEVCGSEDSRDKSEPTTACIIIDAPDILKRNRP